MKIVRARRPRACAIALTFAAAAVTNWQQVLDTPTLCAYSDPTSQNRYKIITQLSNSPLTCFDLLSDVGRRKEWDDMCDEARILEQVDPDTRIVYVRTKPVMFVAGALSVLRWRCAGLTARSVQRVILSCSRTAPSSPTAASCW